MVKLIDNSGIMMFITTYYIIYIMQGRPRYSPGHFYFGGIENDFTSSICAILLPYMHHQDHHDYDFFFSDAAIK
jgi:hypothetical protein